MDWCTYCHFFERECRHCTYSEIWQCLTVAAANSFHSALQGFLDIQNFKIVQTGTSGTRKVSIWSCISCHDKRPAHTHTQTKTTAFFLPPAHIPETFFVGIFQNTSLFGFAMALRGFFPLNDCEVSSRRPHTGFFPAKRQASCWWADLDLQKCLTWMK